MKVFVELTDFAATVGRVQLRDRVRELEEAGTNGISVSDHLLATIAGRSRGEWSTPAAPH